MTTKPVPNPNSLTEDGNRGRRRSRGNASAEGVHEAVEAGALPEETEEEVAAAEEGIDDIIPRDEEATIDQGAGQINYPRSEGDDEIDLSDIAFDLEEEKAMSEAQTEVERAEIMNAEIQREATKARDKKISELKARAGGAVDYKEAERAAYNAAERVRRRHMLKRPRGFYTKDPFRATDPDTGLPIDFPVDARVPLSVLRKLGQRQVLKLLREGTIEDLR